MIVLPVIMGAVAIASFLLGRKSVRQKTESTKQEEENKEFANEQ